MIGTRRRGVPASLGSGGRSAAAALGIRRRGAAFALLAAACAVFAGVAVAVGLQRGSPGTASSAAASGALAAARAGQQRATVFESAGGRVGVAVGGRRVLAGMRCDRVYFAAGRGLCVARGGGFAAGYRALEFDAAFKVTHSLPVAGIPSRARVSPDGRYGAITMFVTGHSYATAGAFSTQTTLIDLAAGKPIANLESFTVMRGEREVTAVDQNFWGVTFARDSDRFYATLATGGRTYLIAGSVRERRARVLAENVECPSLSPDGTRIAYKRRTGSPQRPWRLTVLDLRTVAQTPLAETRSVDDQAEWLDDGHVLYGVAGAVYVVPADGTGAPAPFLEHASSPAVVGA